MTSSFNTGNSLGGSSSGVRLASADPHFVCLGSGRLSTGVTIHQIPLGNLTIGSAESCDIILKGTGILDHHCTIARSNSNEVTLTPSGAKSRILIDGLAITDECQLQQGSMLTIGDSNCLRYNNPTKAEMLKKTAEMNGIGGTKTNENDKFLKNFETNSKNFTENNVPKILNNSGDKKMNNLKLKTNEYYPKVGNLKIYPISSPVSVPENHSMENNSNPNPPPRNNQEEELKKLEEILQVCMDYESSNNVAGSTSNISNGSSSNNGTMERNKTSPTPHQNRIKTNGSLPKNFHTKDSNYFFNNLYENVGDLSSGTDKKYDSDGSCDRIEVPKKPYYSPQSPRTRIKTFIPSPQQSRTSPVPLLGKSEEPTKDSVKNDYEMLIKTFEDKFRMEIANLQKYSENGEFSNVPLKIGSENGKTEENSMKHNGEFSKTDDEREDVEETLNELKKTKMDILGKIRELKIEISDLQRQENEMFHEFDMEKSLVAAEMSTEAGNLQDLENRLHEIKQNMKRTEIERMEKQTSQEVQQTNLKHSIETNQNEIDKLEKLISDKKAENGDVKELENRLNIVTEALENEKKSFEDFEFHYLEEEAEWQSFREDFIKNVEKFSKLVANKQAEIQTLEQTKQNNESLTLEEQKSLELKLVQLKKALEVEREKLKNVDRKLLNNENTYENKNSDDDDEDEDKVSHNMSQSLFFDTNDMLSTTTPVSYSTDKNSNLMSKSFNENMFFNNRNIEIPAFNYLENLMSDNFDSRNSSTSTSTPKKSKKLENNNFNFSFDEDLLKTISSPSNGLQETNRTPSQDDIDRISKVTASAPINPSTERSANYQIRKSFEAIEQNRKLFLASQATNVIDGERQRMELLKKRSSDAARAEYLLIQQRQESQERDLQNGDCVDKEVVIEGYAESIEGKHGNLVVTSVKKSTYSSQNRHSNPEFPEQKSLIEQQVGISNVNSLGTQKYSTSNIELVNNSLGIASRSPKIDNRRENGEKENNSTNSTNQNGDVGLKAGVKRNTSKAQRPLTRYLPNMSQDLNLRQHIESAGHHLQLCPHVIINETSCRGYLSKLGAKFGGWSKRWFVFDRNDKVMLYFSDKSEKKARGGAYFTTINEVYLDHSTTSKSGRNNFCVFVVKTKKRSYHLQAPSAAAARIWIDVIITGALGNLFEY